MDWQLTQKGIKYYCDDHCSIRKNPELVEKYRDKTTYINSFRNHYHLNGTIIDQWLNRSIDIVNHWRTYDKYRHKSFHLVILNIIRNPIDTILSSYNYHKKAAELWTMVPIKELPKLLATFGEKWENICTYDVFTNLSDIMGIDYMNTNVSIEILYNEILSEHQGIYFEFMRYSMCCWYEIYDSYQHMTKIINMDKNVSWIGDKYDWDWIHAKQFRLENFIIDFNRTCNEFLDVFGIIESEHRNNLLDKFQAWRYDEKDKNKMKKFSKAKHVTMGSYDKQQQIEYLLQMDLNLDNVNMKQMQLISASERCNLLRQRTELLHYQWQYDELC